MNKFYRQIRQTLFMEKNPGQYLKYAIGEIVLVVIGILIALSINNWNQQRIENNKSVELLKGITKDLRTDIANHDRMSIHYENRIAFFDRHMVKTDFSSTSIDTILALFDGSTGFFNVTDQSYQKVKNLGISMISQNDSLTDRINIYYTLSKETTELMGDYDFQQTEEENDFWMKEQITVEHNFGLAEQIPLLQDRSEQRMNALELISSPQGRNYLKMEYLRKKMILSYQQRARAQAQELLDDIEEYLKANLS
ncbi:MAG: hypothetical protein HKN39_06520 [Flavobacteriales bacterium]|nr:hypothetical protein [Flavobacteriales bacterium]